MIFSCIFSFCFEEAKNWTSHLVGFGIITAILNTHRTGCATLTAFCDPRCYVRTAKGKKNIFFRFLPALYLYFPNCFCFRPCVCQTSYTHCPLSIELCHWSIYTLSAHVALLECTTEGYHGAQLTVFLLPQNETYRIFYQLNCNDSTMSWCIISGYEVVLFIFIPLLWWTHSSSKWRHVITWWLYVVSILKLGDMKHSWGSGGWINDFILLWAVEVKNI
jgi:hypothetical protein